MYSPALSICCEMFSPLSRLAAQTRPAARYQALQNRDTDMEDAHISRESITLGDDKYLNMFANLPNANCRVGWRQASTGQPGPALVFVEGVRTPFLASLTTFEQMMPHQLLAAAMAGLLQRTGLSPHQVQLGNTEQIFG